MRLEFKGGGSSKFWEIDLDGRRVITRWGHIGTAGQSKEEELATTAEARTTYDRQLAEKLKKGYQLMPGQVPVAPAGKVDPKLEQALQLHPDDESSYLVLADALSEAGDPRGELISVQHALSTTPDNPRLKAREKKLLSAFGLWDPRRVKLTWRWGFVQSAHFHNPKDAFFMRERIEGVDLPWDAPDLDPTELARNVFAMPMCAVLEELQVGLLRWEFQTDDVPSLLKLAATQPFAPRLRRLRFGLLPGIEIDMAHHRVGDLSIIPKAFPALRSLILHAGDFTLAPLHLPELRELTIETCAMTNERLEAVTGAKLPALERLELWFGSENHGANVGVSQLSAILDGAMFGNVKHLGLRNAEFTDALCEAMPGAKILPQLKVLDLSMGTMSEKGARAMTRNPGAFAHLDALIVDDNFLEADALAALQTRGCKIVSKRQKERDATDPEYRYVSVGE